MFSKFMGTSNLNPNTQKLTRNYVILYTITQASFVFADGYLILFMLDKIGYQKAALLFSIQFLMQGLIDFPTGVFADWIGHQWVLVLAYLSHSLTFLILGLYSEINPSSAFNYLLLVILFRSIGTAQESGALQTWFDNNYKMYTKEEDPDNKVYGEIFGKNFIISPILPFIGIIAAAYITDMYSREFLFITQFILIIPIIFLILRLMGEFQSQKTDRKTTKYRKMMKDGFMVIFKSKYIFYITISYLSTMIFINVWSIFFLFPIYFGYTGSDKLANILRAVLFISGVFVSIVASIKTKNLEPKKWIPRMFLITIFTWNLGYLIFLGIYPLPLSEIDAEYNLSAILVVILLGIIILYISVAFFIIFQKILLDEIPDQNRNSFYSLIPTLGVLISALIFPTVGSFIKSSGSMQQTFFVYLTIPLILGCFFSYLARWSETGLQIEEEGSQTSQVTSS